MSSGSFTSKIVAIVRGRWHGNSVTLHVAMLVFFASESAKRSKDRLSQCPSRSERVLAYAFCHLDGSGCRHIPRCYSGKQAFNMCIIALAFVKALTSICSTCYRYVTVV